MAEKEDLVELGGNIELSGFSSVDGGMMIVLKKIIGNYARRFSDKGTNFEKLSLNVKSVHEKEGHGLHEMHAKVLDNGKVFASKAEDRNIFVAVDSALKKVSSEMKIK
ncbi:hypothetical protein GF336_03600 [Candidatus Woesearchaeota archaeon]|nr:hypothetical protein [Candidatus Woesearchaeota archaeon]